MIQGKKLTYSDLKEGDRVYVEYSKDGFWMNTPKDGIETVVVSPHFSITLSDVEDSILGNIDSVLEDGGIEIFEIISEVETPTKEFTHYESPNEELIECENLYKEGNWN